MRKLLPILFLAALPAAADIRVPTGFHVDVFARELGAPRAILALEDGTVLVSRPAMNDVVALRDRDHDGRVDEIRTAVASIEHAHGLAMRGRTLYVAGVKTIVAADRLPDGSFASPRDVVTDLPDGGRHPHRTIGAGPDGKLYVAIGSSCDDCTETNPEHATILQIDANGEHRRIYARGLRNTAGFDWSPATGELWAGDTGEINRIGDGLHYGWPLCAGRNLVQQTSVELEGITREKFCRNAEGAALDIASRTAPSGFVFYRGTQFPEPFRTDAFSLVGNDVVRVRFQDGKAAAAEKFASGFDGHLAGATVAADGSLLVSDDAKGVVYRVSFGERAPQAMTSSAAETQSKPVLSKAFGLANLRGPESVLHDEEQDVYFVSNVDGEPGARDGKGFIARVTPDGKLAELKFIDGLDAPKGMAIRRTELWIADIDRLHAFDRVTGAHRTTLNLAPHGAVSLRDVAVGADDAIYVTDSDVRIKGSREHVRAGDGRVFRLIDDEVEVIASGEELRSPSAIEWDGTRFLIAQEYGREVLAWNPGYAAKAVMRGPGSFDGMVVLPNGAVIVSSHHDDALHIAYGGGELRPLFARRPSPGGIGFDRKRNRLLIPSVDGDWLEAWTLPPMPPPQRTSSDDGALEMARH
ncbi:MAG TPA: PQQ-dependent sugar dehydrogenase [Thermoanaerobaculia bacterium]|nr:PQQ-dependent sugar dehydrogenase [Thermoanaerobaculia bacterium]